eukprot:GFYU01010626.1.p1 GENE.GFYU01010626.1~~GFYU01010626.1.p1  ORF type:complete len:101 (+),score=41.40 GFYU01010626.1:46-348(+)
MGDIQVSEILIPILEELENVKAGLADLSQGPHRMDDINPFQDVLRAIDGNRVDGVFGGDPQGNIPEGQGLCHDLLAECYELVEICTDSAEDPDNDNPDED